MWKVQRSFNAPCPACGNSRAKDLRRTFGEYQFLSCPECSFQFIYPYVEDGWNFDDYAWTKQYTDNYTQYVGPILGSMRSKIEDFESIAGRKPSSFLDIGCGNGLYLHAADVLGMRNLGTDVDRISVEFAKGRGLNAVMGAVDQMKILEKFDFVHIKAVLHLVPDPPRLLAKAVSLLAPGGVVYIDVPNQGSLFSKLRILRDRTAYGQLQLPLRRGAYNFRALAGLCERNGLRIVKRLYPYPGDRAYYPLDNSGYNRTLFKMLSIIRLSSIIGIYLVNATKQENGNDE